jgi:hypothetical protein
LPARPSTSAHCTRAWNANVCAAPTSTTGSHGGGRSGSRRASSKANSTALPSTERNAANSNGPL